MKPSMNHAAVLWLSPFSGNLTTKTTGIWGRITNLLLLVDKEVIEVGQHCGLRTLSTWNWNQIDVCYEDRTAEGFFTRLW